METNVCIQTPSFLWGEASAADGGSSMDCASVREEDSQGQAAEFSVQLLHDPLVRLEQWKPRATLLAAGKMEANWLNFRDTPFIVW